MPALAVFGKPGAAKMHVVRSLEQSRTCLFVCNCWLRAKALHDSRQAESKQALSQMDDRVQQFEKLAANKTEALAAKAEAETKLKVCLDCTDS
jgi:hypothetical protein